MHRNQAIVIASGAAGIAYRVAGGKRAEGQWFKLGAKAAPKETLSTLFGEAVDRNYGAEVLWRAGCSAQGASVADGWEGVDPAMKVAFTAFAATARAMAPLINPDAPEPKPARAADPRKRMTRIGDKSERNAGRIGERSKLTRTPAKKAKSASGATGTKKAAAKKAS